MTKISKQDQYIRYTMLKHSLTNEPHSGATQEEINHIIKQLENVDESIAIMVLDIMVNILKHPLVFMEAEYTEVVNDVQKNQNNGLLAKFYRHNPQKLITSLTEFILNRMDIRAYEDLLHKKKTALELELHAHDPFNIQAMLMLMENVLENAKPQAHTPTAMKAYYPIITDMIAYINKLEKLSDRHLQSALREDDIDLVGHMNAKTSSGTNRYHYDIALQRINRLRETCAEKIYPNLKKFLSLKHDVYPHIAGATVTACQFFCNDPSERHLKELLHHLSLEKKIANRKRRQRIKQFEMEAIDVTFHHYQHQIETHIDGLDPLTLASVMTVREEVSHLKNTHQEQSLYLIETLHVTTNALAQPLVYSDHLKTHAEKMQKQGHQPLAGKLFCLVGALTFLSAITMTVVGGFLLWPFTLPLGKLGLSLMFSGAAMVAPSVYATAKGRTFFSNHQYDALNKELVHLKHHIDEKMTQRATLRAS